MVGGPFESSVVDVVVGDATEVVGVVVGGIVVATCPETSVTTVRFAGTMVLCVVDRTAGMLVGTEVVVALWRTCAAPVGDGSLIDDGPPSVEGWITANANPATPSAVATAASPTPHHGIRATPADALADLGFTPPSCLMSDRGGDREWLRRPQRT